ncbi:hypothetical protein M5X11_10460 [Paenibacillus alginolyticus]|uniref:Uncharacterized protein n=1 Tax=Paenibacillus alginolyticus TaxID=59839 RepID=A0ABT4G5G1_9BACL|nr:MULTISPECIES: hypothetical protein [Paenibacillus]MCY9665378.1 hypothetical protein [Paenibacillus alginolyticus]MCY9691402.1 hypothetical protein [Paenibacillus alginolyticus]MEC0146510.1 hypothetical protein [Paenibacillus alginolyticus]NRF95958.1 hypothetical protein [Paenibacillus frigoriresistens]
MEFRRLGRTNLNVSCVGFGGAPMGLDNYLEPYEAKNKRFRCHMWYADH